jgi:hypothetical protein
VVASHVPAIETAPDEEPTATSHVPVIETLHDQEPAAPAVKLSDDPVVSSTSEDEREDEEEDQVGVEGDNDAAATKTQNITSALPTLFSRPPSSSPQRPAPPRFTQDGDDPEFERLQRAHRLSAADLLAQAETEDNSPVSSGQPSRASSANPPTPPLTKKALKSLYNQSSDEGGSSPEDEDEEDDVRRRRANMSLDFEPKEPTEAATAAALKHVDEASNSTSSDSEAGFGTGEPGEDDDDVASEPDTNTGTRDDSSGEQQDEEDRIQVEELLSSSVDASNAKSRFGALSEAASATQTSEGGTAGVAEAMRLDALMDRQLSPVEEAATRVSKQLARKPSHCIADAFLIATNSSTGSGYESVGASERGDKRTSGRLRRISLTCERHPGDRRSASKRSRDERGFPATSSGATDQPSCDFSPNPS